MLVPDGLAQGTMCLHASSEERLFCRYSLPWDFSSSLPAPLLITRVKPISCLLKSWFKSGSRWKSVTAGATRPTRLRQTKLKTCWWRSEGRLDSRLALWTASLMRTHTDRPPVQDTWRTSVDAIHTQANLSMLHTHTSCLEMSASSSLWSVRSDSVAAIISKLKSSLSVWALAWEPVDELIIKCLGGTPDIKYY